MASSSGNQDSELVTGINVTPMVDITLVLLIIFMVTASFIVNSGLKVNLPKASTTEAQATASLTVTLDQNGDLFLMKNAVDVETLKNSLAREAVRNPGVRVSLAADRGLEYGKVIRVLDIIKQAGVTKVALSSEK